MCARIACVTDASGDKEDGSETGKKSEKREEQFRRQKQRQFFFCQKGGVMWRVEKN